MDPTPQALVKSHRPSLAVRLLLGLISAYRLFLSPFMGQHCRFHPSCSLYCREALIRHGALRGSALTLWRLARCQPWARGGEDPVPPHPFPTSLTDTSH